MRPLKKPQRLARETVYQSPWVNLYVDRVRLPAGRIIERHHVLDFDHEAVAAVVEDAQGCILMIKSHRYVTDSLAWEVPAGRIEKDEKPCQAASREVLEETGYYLQDCRLIYSYYPSNGISNQRFHIASARLDSMRSQKHFDRNEVAEVRWMPPAEIRQLIAAQALSDGYSLTALLLHLREAH